MPTILPAYFPDTLNLVAHAPPGNQLKAETFDNCEVSVIVFFCGGEYENQNFLKGTPPTTPPGNKR